MSDIKDISRYGIIALSVFVILFSQVAFAYSGGTGTSGDPYQIANLSDLSALTTDTGNYDKSFILTDDINLAGQVFTAAIIAPDSFNFTFSGDFNGAGHKISNLTIASDGVNGVGLFGGVNGGNIENLIIENVTAIAGSLTSNLGGLAGYCYDSNVLNCSSSGNVKSGDNSYYTGGLIGSANFSNIRNCSTSGNVSGGQSSYYLGGLAGYCQNSFISGCNSSSNIDINSTTSGTAGSYIGGLAGSCPAGGSLNNCSATGSITNTGNSSYYLGGLIGFSQADINDCFATGNIITNGDSHYTGGLAGNTSAPIRNCYTSGDISCGGGSCDYVGGLAGHTTDIIDNCHASGNVTGIGYYSNYLGGLAGWAEANIAGSYATGNVAGIDSNSQYFGGLVGLGSGENINDCHSTGNVTTGNSAVYIGGLAGSASRNINQCYSTGNVAGGNSSSWIGGLAGIAYSDINNCYTSGSVSGGDFSQQLGGLAGIAYGQITRCSSSGSVSGGNTSSYLGGLVANAYIDCNIIYCYSTGTVSGGSSSQVIGGLAGYNYGSISNCYSLCSVAGGDSSQTIGGLVGFSVGDINRSFATGPLAGGNNSHAIGGFAGAVNSSSTECYSTGNITAGITSSYLGGFIGYNYGDITDCYSAGIITAGPGSTNIGGLMGANDNGIYRACYFRDVNAQDNGIGIPLTNAAMKKQLSFAGFDFVGETVNGANDVWVIYTGVTYPKLTWNFSALAVKCTVAAGAKPNTDSISVAGLTLATGYDFNDANASDSNFVEVSINSPDMNIPFVLKFPINAKTYKKGKYSYSGTEDGIKKTFKYDSKSRKFSLTAKKAKFAGLGCPFTCQIKVGSYTGAGTLDETLVNGSKKPIPIKFMMGVKDSIRVDKISVKRSSTTGILSASGGFSVQATDLNDVNMADSNLIVSLGDSQTFTIPAKSLKAGKNKFSCTKAVVYLDGVAKGTAAVTFDFNKCTFKITIRNTKITAGPGSIDFNVQFADYDQVQAVNIR